MKLRLLRPSRLLVLAAFAAALALAASAAANDARVSFSTTGPDRYADGTVVLDDEWYALVWESSGAESVVFGADGSVEGGAVVRALRLAMDGRCRNVLFTVPASDLASKYAGGTWGVYLLDTRRWGADGEARPSESVDGRPRSVNATCRVAGVRVAQWSSDVQDVDEPATASTATAVPDGAPRPEIVGVRVEGGSFCVTARGTVPYLQYDLATGGMPDALTGRANAPRGGAESPDEEVVFTVPVTAPAAFFRLVRRE